MNLIFDLDGVIVDSKKSVELRIQATLDRYNRKGGICTEEIIGKSPQECVRIFLETDDEELIKEATKYYLECFESRDINESCLYPHMEEVIEVLSRKNNLYIVTCRPEKHAIMLINYFNIDEYFHDIWGTSFKYFQNKLDILRHFIDAYEYDGELEKDVAYIGDRKEDMDAANECGIRSVFASWGYASLEEELTSVATIHCYKPELLPIVIDVLKEENLK